MWAYCPGFDGRAVLWKLRQPLEILGHCAIGLDQRRRVIASLVQLLRLVVEVAVREVSPDRESERLHETPHDRIVMPLGKDDPLAQCVSILQRLRRDQESAFGSIEVGGNEDERPTPGGEARVHGRAGEGLQPSIRRRAPQDLGAIPVAAGEGRRTVDFRWREKAPIVHCGKMLKVEAMGGRHVPRTIAGESKHFARRKVGRVSVGEERQGKQGDRAVEHEHIPVTLDHRERGLSCKGRDLGAVRDHRAASIRAIFPAVKWTLDVLSSDAPVAEVRAEVRTACVEHRDAAAGCSVSNQITSKHALGHRFPVQFIRAAEQIP